MKYAIVTLLFMISTVATVAIAQDGGGHGPPRLPIIVMPQPTPAPTTASPTAPGPKLWQLKLRPSTMTK
jgi:hypothetical protein